MIGKITHSFSARLLSFGVLALVASSTAQSQGLGVVGNLLSGPVGPPTLQVRTVVPGGLASRLGVFPGDEIISINGLPPGDAVNNERAIASGRGRVALVVSRRGQRITLGNAVSPIGPIVGPIGPPIIPGIPSLPVGPIYPGNQRGPDLQIDLEVVQTLSGQQVRVIRVVPRGLGDRRGIRAGDVLDSVNRIPVSTTDGAARAYVYRNGVILLRLIRNGRPYNIRLTQSNTPSPTPRPASVKLKPLGLKVFRNNTGLIVSHGTSDGLAQQLGLAKRGTVIRSINGTAARSQGDIDRVDTAIRAGTVTRLEIEFTHPGGKRDVIRYPR